MVRFRVFGYSECHPAFENFQNWCGKKASDNGWQVGTVMNYELRPYGKLIKTNTQGWYLRFTEEKYLNLWLLRWR